MNQGARTELTVCLIYTRVSSDEQARDGVSLDAQLTEARRYAAQRGWLLGQEYQDILSGRRDDRPQYQALLAEVRHLRVEGSSVAVVVMRLDRLGRRILERVRCREELKTLGVPVHSVREGGEVSDLVANILASVAEEEARALGERVSAALSHIAAGGWYVCGRVPWGYRWREATPEERRAGAPAKVLDINPQTMPYVREAFARAADGQTLHAVHRWVAGLPSEARGGCSMHYQAVRRVLMSPAYVARSPHGVEDVLARPVGNWPVTVDDETWRRVRANVAGHQRLPRQASQSHMLTGLVRCPACGSRMHGRTRIKRGRVYACGSRNRGADTPTWACNYQALGEAVEAAVLAQVAPVIEAAAALPNLQEMLRLHWERLRGRSSDLGEFHARRVQQLEQVAARATERLTKAAVLYADGDIDKIGYELLRDKARDDLAAAEAGLAGLVQPDRGPDLPPFEAVVAEASGWGAILREGDTAAVRQVVAALVDRIVPVRLGTGRYAVEIAWTDAGEALRLLANSAEERPAA